MKLVTLLILSLSLFAQQCSPGFVWTNTDGCQDSKYIGYVYNPLMFKAYPIMPPNTNSNSNSNTDITSPAPNTTIPSFSCNGLAGFNYSVMVPNLPDEICHVKFIPVLK